MSPIPWLRRGVKGGRVLGPVGPAEPRPATGSTDLKHVVNLDDDELARVNKLMFIVEDRLGEFRRILLLPTLDRDHATSLLAQSAAAGEELTRLLTRLLDLRTEPPR